MPYASRVASRPAIPRPLEREVLVEAGYHCAIPTCRQHPVEIHHIVPWAKAKEHTFDNLIALCPNDHALAEQGKIDRQALLIYKRNLGLITGRYGDMERRLLRVFAESPDARTITVERSMDFEFLYLLQDGLLVKVHEEVMMRVGNFTQGPVIYGLTDLGADLVRRWSEGLLIEED